MVTYKVGAGQVLQKRVRAVVTGPGQAITRILTAGTVPAAIPVRAWDYQTGDLSQWQEPHGAAPIIVTDQPRRGMSYAAKFTAVGGQAADFDAGANPAVDRTEMSEYDLARCGNIAPGVEQWWAFSVMCPTNLVAPTSWCLFLDFHHNAPTGQTPVWFAIQPNSSPPRLMLVVRGGNVNSPTVGTYDLGVAPLGSWIDFRFYILWSDSATGRIIVKKNTQADGAGFTVAQDVTAPNMYTGYGMYVNEGVYRNTVNRTEVWHHTGLRRGASEASVTY